MQNKKIHYRADIDGLRAIAVLAVIFYHLDFQFLSGGYVGVDIFFVISGFLISKIIDFEIQENIFSLSNFYIRRIRRIFPALFLVVWVTSLASVFVLPQSALQEFSASILSVTWFTSNLFFLFNNDYFSVAASLKPLLHTWSLSVEEQFYLFFPLFLVFINRHGFDGRRSLLLIIIISLVLSILLAKEFSSINFYIAPTRAWEFLLGALLGMNLIPEIKQRLVRHLLSLLGLLLIIASILILNDKSVFPGINALYPVLGTALLIYTGCYENSARIQAIGNWAISNPLLRNIGLISYSLYLWHWPAISLLKNTGTGIIDFYMKLLILCVVFALSLLTWKFVEQPFRIHKKLKQAVTLKSGFMVLIVATFLGAGLYFYSAHLNITEHSLNREKALQQLSTLKQCFLKEETLESVERCSFGDKNSDKIFLLWGDSHSLAMYPAFVKLAEDSGWKGIRASLSSCPPLFGIRVEGVEHCNGEMSHYIKTFLQKNKINTIFLVARWNLYETGWYRNGKLMKPTSFVSDQQTTSIDAIMSTQVLHKGMSKTIDFLSKDLNIPINILLPVPSLPKLIDDYTPKSINIVSRKDYEEQKASLDNYLKRFKSNPLINIIDPINIYCPKKDCLLFESGFPMYLDDNHLSPRAAIKLLPLLKKGLFFRNNG
jgi:peptidoglycan/LPS O-acetylase OafA/YrhL